MNDRAVGIIAEYNPFHNGHLWQLQTLRERLGDVAVVVCMSGWFVQRGEAALIDPWKRAEAAVRNGADLVLLLPSFYSLRSADYFAAGAVKLLMATGVVDTLACSAEHAEGGTVSESPDTSLVSLAAWSLEKAAEQQVRSFLKQGFSYGAAWEKAAAESGQDAGWLTGSNNILAFAYQKAVMRHCPGMTVLLLQRQGSVYNEEKLIPPYASASAIRNALRNGADPASLGEVMPETSAALLKNLTADREEAPARRDKRLTSLLSYYLSYSSSRDIYEHSSAGRDLCDRFFNARDCLRQGYADFCRTAASKRDSLPSVRRLSLQLLLQQNRSFWTKERDPSYLRVLAFNDRGRALLKKMKKTAALPLIVKPGRRKKYVSTDLYSLMQADILSADLYQILGGAAGTYGTYLTMSPVYSSNSLHL